MNSIADSFGWPFQDPGWFGKMILQGLIGIIPIVGWIALCGWLMITIDNYRAGRQELAPAGFHLGRGIEVFVVFLVYGIVVGIPGALLTNFGAALNSSGLTSLGGLVNLVLWLFLAYLTPALILFTYRGGISGGFDVSRIWHTVTVNTSATFPAAVVIVVAEFISGLGAILCLVGLLFTIPYAAAIAAGTATWYERAIAGATPASPPGPTS
jgi:hypothetical protein